MKYMICFEGYVVVEANDQDAAELKVGDAMCEKVQHSDEFTELSFEIIETSKVSDFD